MHNRYVHKPGLQDIVCGEDGKLAVGRFSGLPNLTANESLTPSACFIGPRAENIEVMTKLATASLKHINDYRKDFHSKDPDIRINKEQHDESVEAMEKRFGEMLTYLKTYATPFNSMRYQGHMLSDVLMPGLAGYFVGMMHNSNNVTIQASTETTLLEMMVMRDLCDMLGFPNPPKAEPKAEAKPNAWSHITVDGSVANLEGMWSAREAKLLPFAVKAAYTKDASKIAVTLCTGQHSTLDKATDWELLNLTRDERLGLPAKIVAASIEKDISTVWGKVIAQNLNAKGWAPFTGLNSANIWPAVLVPSTAHYSWPKAAAVLGLNSTGYNIKDNKVGPGLNHVAVDQHARMSISALEKRLDDALNHKLPVLLVVSVFGSTEEGAVDDLGKILSLRQKYRKQGLDFDIHVDAAWGGYMVSTIRRPYALEALPKATNLAAAAMPEPFVDDAARARVPLNDHVVAQAQIIREADSVTVDAHKMGYIQYPNGTILYRDENTRNLTTFTGSYIGSASVPTVGLFGIEGSRPGAAAAALYFAHSCLRPDCNGYGEIINLSVYNAKQFYSSLQFVENIESGPRWRTVTLTPLSSDIPKSFLKSKILGRSLEEIRSDSVTMAALRTLGPDQNLVDFGFNFHDMGAGENTSASRYNAYIQSLYEAMSVKFKGDGKASPIAGMQFMVSMTTFDRTYYGDEFMDSFAKQLGLVKAEGDPIDKLNCLRSSVMGPFVSDTVAGSFWPTLTEIIKEIVTTVTTHPPS